MINDGSIDVHTPHYNIAAIKYLRGASGKWQPDNRCWHVSRPSRELLKKLRNIFGVK